MSHERNIKWLNDRRIVYKQLPISDKPTVETDQYMFFENGTYENYCLFNTKAKITTYKSLKWHFLVLYYLNEEVELYTLFRFIADKENGFVTFFIKLSVLNNMIESVLNEGVSVPRNKMRKVIFKDYSGLTPEQKMSVVGKLIGRACKVDQESIYQIMLDINDAGDKITISRMAGLLDCSSRTIYRSMNKELTHEKKLLNEEV